ncbi:hypothetical protein DFS34DRAFT_579452 [Phlyctochytrium arcticum]|nr:hypothetical protein DFS34DRAFT_579452 [Phlyctochytrium arcticum]
MLISLPYTIAPALSVCRTASISTKCLSNARTRTCTLRHHQRFAASTGSALNSIQSESLSIASPFPTTRLPSRLPNAFPPTLQSNLLPPTAPYQLPSAQLINTLWKRHFSGMHQFDTYKLVQRLEADGFSRESAEAIMANLSEVVGESINNISRTSVTKSDFEKAMYMNKVDFAHVRNEIQLLEKNEFALLRTDISRLNTEVEKFRTRMIEDLRRVQSNVRLELSLEKGRIRDEQSAQELKIKESDSRIDTEVSTVRTQMETIQWDLFKTLFRKCKVHFAKCRKFVLIAGYLFPPPISLLPFPCIFFSPIPLFPLYTHTALFCAAGALFFSMLLTFGKTPSPKPSR